MAHEVYWDSLEERRLVLEFGELVTWEEFHTGVREAHAVISAAHQPTILVVWAKPAFPDGLALWRLSSAFQAQPRNLVQTIVIPDKNPSVVTFARALAGIIRRLYPGRNEIVFTRTIEEARAVAAPADTVVLLK